MPSSRDLNHLSLVVLAKFMSVLCILIVQKSFSRLFRVCIRDVTIHSVRHSLGKVPLSEFKLLAKERFFYDYGFDDINVPVWRHDIRFEAALVVDRERLPHCIGGVGIPPLEQTGSPQELSNLADLFTPQFVLNQMTELVDCGSSDAQLAQHIRHLRPWLTAERFSQRSANRRLLASHGGAE